MRRIDNEKRYTYTLIDKYYKADNFVKGRAFKAFFDEFCKDVFEFNLVLFEDKSVGCFPLLYSEKQGYASVISALNKQTPYILSEWYLGYKPRNADSDESKYRFVDFWFMNEKKEFEAWMEMKHIWFNFGKRAKADFMQDIKKEIYDALKQIEIILKDANAKQVAKKGTLNVVLLSIYVYCKKTQISDDESIINAPQLVADLLNDEQYRIKWRGKSLTKGVLCGVLDLDPHFALKEKMMKDKEQKGLIYTNEYTPYAILAAIVFEA